ncbi:LOW QUALITY PROTEIN: fibroblast growth factor-binding protein 3 [Rhinophrynus dorsalis]
MLLNYKPSAIPTNEMRLYSVISFIWFVNCQGVFGKNEKTASKRGEPQMFSRSGQFLTKTKHDCTWEIIGEDKVSLSLSCNEQGNNYMCTYEGEPQKCPSYSMKAKQYWKQILGKFKKMKNACEENTLKSRICKKSAAVESQLVRVGVDVGEEVKKEKSKGKSQGKEPGKGQERRSKTAEVYENVGSENKSDVNKKKPGSKSNQKPDPSMPPSESSLFTTAREVNDDIVEMNEDLAGTYCTEKWHSMCSFFVNFWNG